MYKSAIFIPIIDTGIATVVTGHELVDKDSMRDIYNRRNLQQSVRGVRTQF